MKPALIQFSHEGCLLGYNAFIHAIEKEAAHLPPFLIATWRTLQIHRHRQHRVGWILSCTIPSCMH